MDPPPALSEHNGYHLWGPGGCTERVRIVMDDDRERLLERFEDVELAATSTCDDCMPYENDKTIRVCRGLRMPVATLWPELRHLD